MWPTVAINITMRKILKCMIHVSLKTMVLMSTCTWSQKTCFSLMLVLEVMVSEAGLQDLSLDNNLQSYCIIESKNEFTLDIVNCCHSFLGGCCRLAHGWSSLGLLLLCGSPRSWMWGLLVDAFGAGFCGYQGYMMLGIVGRVWDKWGGHLDCQLLVKMLSFGWLPQNHIQGLW